MMAMKAFFWVNRKIFVDQQNKLNKGRAVLFAEEWYGKLLDPEEEISVKECLLAFESTFLPRDIQD